MTAIRPGLGRFLVVSAVVWSMALSLTACGGGSDGAAEAGGDGSGCPADWPETIVVGQQEFTPVVVSSDLGVGANRFTMVLLDKDAKGNIGGPDVDVETAFYDLDRSRTDPVSAGAATRYQVHDVATFYSQPVDFDAAGTWGAKITVSEPGQEPRCEQVRFSVLEASRAPSVGDAAPRSSNKTVADAAGGDLSTITSDVSPDPRLYGSTVAELLDAHKPFVVAFATPKFCQSRTCGPVVDQIKDVMADHPELDFVHVEVYDDLASSRPARYVPALSEWRLPSEPWVFVVGADGRIVDRFEGAMSDTDLRGAVAKVAGQ